MADAGLLDRIIDRLLTSHADAAPKARNAMRQLVVADGRTDAASRLGPPEVMPPATPTR
jgi:hypothetical protein